MYKRQVRARVDGANTSDGFIELPGFLPVEPVDLSLGEEEPRGVLEFRFLVSGEAVGLSLQEELPVLLGKPSSAVSPPSSAVSQRSEHNSAHTHRPGAHGLLEVPLHLFPSPAKLFQRRIRVKIRQVAAFHSSLALSPTYTYLVHNTWYHTYYVVVLCTVLALSLIHI